MIVASVTIEITPGIAKTYFGEIDFRSAEEVMNLAQQHRHGPRDPKVYGMADAEKSVIKITKPIVMNRNPQTGQTMIAPDIIDEVVIAAGDIRNVGKVGSQMLTEYRKATSPVALDKGAGLKLDE